MIGFIHLTDYKYLSRYDRNIRIYFSEHCSSKKRKFEKRAINKFRRKQLKLDEIIKCNRFGKYWA